MSVIMLHWCDNWESYFYWQDVMTTKQNQFSGCQNSPSSGSQEQQIVLYLHVSCSFLFFLFCRIKQDLPFLHWLIVASLCADFSFDRTTSLEKKCELRSWGVCGRLQVFPYWLCNFSLISHTVYHNLSVALHFIQMHKKYPLGSGRDAQGLHVPEMYSHLCQYQMVLRVYRVRKC